MVPSKTFLKLDEEKKNRITQAAIDVFASEPYSSVKLSAIIKKAKIPRGSLYSYFKDKKDLYLYIFTIIAEEKMKHIGNLIFNPDDMKFTELFMVLYEKGLEFAVSNPQYIRITYNLVFDGSGLYKELFEDNMKVARDFYRGFIEADKKKGFIRDDIDTEVLTDFIIDAVSNIAFEEIRKNKEIDYKTLYRKAKTIVSILEKGIEGEQNV